MIKETKEHEICPECGCTKSMVHKREFSFQEGTFQVIAGWAGLALVTLVTLYCGFKVLTTPLKVEYCYYDAKYPPTIEVSIPWHSDRRLWTFYDPEGKRTSPSVEVVLETMKALGCPNTLPTLAK